MFVLLDPVAMPRAAAEQPLPLIPVTHGRRIGILTNHWKSMDLMAERMALRLKNVYRAVNVQLYDIPINGAMTETTRSAVIRDCDAVIVGLAN